MKKSIELRNKLNELMDQMKGFLEKRELDKIKELRNEIAETKELLAVTLEIEEEEKRALKNQGNNKIIDKRNIDKREELRAVSKIALGRKITEEERSLVTLEGNTALLPDGYINQLEIYRKGFPSLKQYCHVIPVNNKNGKMPTATLGGNTLANLTSDLVIPEGSMTTNPISYTIEDYGKFVPIEKDLEDDAVVDLINSILLPDFAEGGVARENLEIIKIIKDNSTEIVGATSYEDLENAIDTALPAVKTRLITITNTQGYAYLKNKKDKQGRNLDLITNINGVDYFDGKPLIYLDDTAIEPKTEGNHIFYIVNLFEVAKFFDRKGILIETSREFLFNKNQDCIRAIERFDVAIGNKRSAKVIEFAK